MARVVAFVPDLLFGSNVIGALKAAGHDAVLVSSADQLAGALGPVRRRPDRRPDRRRRTQRIELVRGARPGGLKTLAFYSHVEHDVRDRGRAGRL